MRQRELADGRQSIFLDRVEDGQHHYEFLKLYLVPERTAKATRLNAATLRKAGTVLRERTEEFYLQKSMRQNSALSGEITLLDWLRSVLEEDARRGLRESTFKKRCIRTVEAFAPTVKLKDVDKQFCISYIDFLRSSFISSSGKPYAAITAERVSGTLRSALNKAVRAGHIAFNPWNKVETIDRIHVPPGKREYLTVEELKRLIAAPSGKAEVKAAFLFACFCGLRISDLSKLDWRDIYCDGGRWRLSVVMAKTTTPIHIPLSCQAMKWLPARPADGGLVFPALHPLGKTSKFFAGWAASAGVSKHITFHVARHTFATMMLTLGADLYVVSKLLGHSSVSITQIYAKIIDKKKDDAVNLADSVEW